MEVKRIGAELSRFDTRLPKEQKALFEYAASLGGYRTLTEFIVSVVQEKAQEIVAHHETILASQKDHAAFFDALMNPPAPQARLVLAAERHRKASSGQ